MKNASLLLLTSLLLTALASPAQNFNLIKDQARRAGQAQNNASAGGNLTPPPPAPTPAPAAPAVNPALNATLQNISALSQDITRLIGSDPANPDPALKAALLNDLVEAAQGTKPTKESLQKFADRLITTVAGHKTLRDAAPRLGQCLHALSNASHLSDAQQTQLTGVLSKLLVKAGIFQDDADQLVESIKTISAQTK